MTCPAEKVCELPLLPELSSEVIGDVTFFRVYFSTTGTTQSAGLYILQPA